MKRKQAILLTERSPVLYSLMCLTPKVNGGILTRRRLHCAACGSFGATGRG